MPGPVLRLAGTTGESSDFAIFQSCDDVQEAWGGLNNNLSEESVYHDCLKSHRVEHRKTYINGNHTISSRLDTTEQSEATTTKTATTSLNNNIIEKTSVAQMEETTRTEAQECGEDMEMEDELPDEAVETINMPVVEASLCVDLNSSLTRHKISSVQRGRTLSYVDKDDVEDSPTRRARPLVLAYANESTEMGTPLHQLPATSEAPKQDKSPRNARVDHRAIRVSRNPSYHFAVRDATILTPHTTPKAQPFKKNSRSCDNSPSRTAIPMESLVEESLVAAGGRRHASESDGLVTAPLATNMPRSVSFSGPESLSPAVPASGSLSEGNSRSGSASQLSTPTSPAPPLPLGGKPTPNFTRSSVITRSFRRLFSTPSRSPPAIQTEEVWEDNPSCESDPKSSRLRKLSTSLSRRLSTRSKMSGSSGTNGQHILVPNGSSLPEDPRSLVEYEDLLKLFCCSGCQSFMAPPLHQCRKGHLVCSTCRTSLKQVCPTCKQRFADTTNVMMEQVCQLVKFPCKYAAQGCPEYHRPRAKLDHEHFCVYRPVHCHHGPQGCPKVLLLRDMHQHLDKCEFKGK